MDTDRLRDRAKDNGLRERRTVQRTSSLSTFESGSRFMSAFP